MKPQKVSYRLIGIIFFVNFANRCPNKLIYGISHVNGCFNYFQAFHLMNYI